MGDFYTYGKTNCWYCHREFAEEDVHTEEVGPRHYMLVCTACCTCPPKSAK